MGLGEGWGDINPGRGLGNAITWFNYHALPAIGGNANNTPVFLTWGLRGYIGAGGRDEKCGLIREISNPGFPPQSHDRGSRNQNPVLVRLFIAFRKVWMKVKL